MDCGLSESRLDRPGNPDLAGFLALRPESRGGRAHWLEPPRFRPEGSIEREDMMAQTFIGRKRVRKFFGKIEEVAEMPNLIEVQKASYDQFLLVVEPQGGRPNEGLQAVFKSVFPISGF